MIVSSRTMKAQKVIACAQPETLALNSLRCANTSVELRLDRTADAGQPLGRDPPARPHEAAEPAHPVGRHPQRGDGDEQAGDKANGHEYSSQVKPHGCAETH